MIVIALLGEGIRIASVINALRRDEIKNPITEFVIIVSLGVILGIGIILLFITKQRIT